MSLDQMPVDETLYLAISACHWRLLRWVAAREGGAIDNRCRQLSREYVGAQRQPARPFAVVHVTEWQRSRWWRSGIGVQRYARQIIERVKAQIESFEPEPDGVRIHGAYHMPWLPVRR